jgi:hypothetical protein
VFERIAASFDLARSSWNVLRQDKQLIVFPVVSGIGCMLVLASFAIPFTALRGWEVLANAKNGVQDVPWWMYVLAFAFYFCNYFVIIFCNAALVSCALMRFGGHQPTVAAGFQAAMSRLPQICGWALVSATVGLLLKWIESANEKVGRFISGLLGAAWTVMTYFVVPVLVVEKVGPIQAISRSVQILRKTWGEALIGKIGLGLFTFLLMIPGILLVFGGAMVAVNHTGVGIALAALGLIYLLVASAAASALNGIFLSALYQYAEVREIPEGFDRSVLERAFGKR